MTLNELLLQMLQGDSTSSLYGADPTATGGGQDPKPNWFQGPPSFTGGPGVGPDSAANWPSPRGPQSYSPPDYAGGPTGQETASGSMPQPAPLSGLPLANLFSGFGFGEDSGLSVPSGARGGGQAPGPALDLFPPTVSGGPIEAGQGPNLSSIFASLGQNTGLNAPLTSGLPFGFAQLFQGLFNRAGGPPQDDLAALVAKLGMGGDVAAGGFGQAGMTSNAGPSGPSGGQGGPTGQQQAPSGPSPAGTGATGGAPDVLALIQQALGLGSKVAGAVPSGTVSADGTATSPSDLSGLASALNLTGQQGSTADALTKPGDLISSFFADPTIGKLFTSGMLTGSMIPQDLFDQFSKDPAFMNALVSGNATEVSNLLAEHPFGDIGHLDLSGLTDPAASGGSNLGGALGGLGSLFGLGQDIKGKKPLGMLKDLYGVYNSANSLFDLGGPTATSLLSNLADSLGWTGSAASAAAAGAGEAGTLAGEGLASGVSSLVSSLTSFLSPYSLALNANPAFGIALSDWVAEMFGSGPHVQELIQSKIQEHKNINRDFQTAFGQVEGGEKAWADLAAGAPINAKDLTDLNTAMQAIGGGALSQFFGTSGGEEHATGLNIPGMPKEQLDALAKRVKRDTDATYWGLLGGADEAARAGLAFPEIGPLFIDSPLSALKHGVGEAGAMDPSVYTYLGGKNSTIPGGKLGEMLWGTAGTPMEGNPDVWNYGTQGAAPADFLSKFTPGNYLNAIGEFLAPYSPHIMNSPFAQFAGPFGNNYPTHYGTPTDPASENMARVKQQWEAEWNAMPGGVIPPDYQPAPDQWQTMGGGG